MDLGHWKRYFYYCGWYFWYSQFRGRPGARKSELRTEWKLQFGYIQNYLLSSGINAQFPWLFAAEVINAFCVSWHDLQFYCFPPFSCSFPMKVLQKIISDNATGILTVPSQVWFTILQDLLLTEGFIIPRNADNLYLYEINLISTILF